VSAGLLLALAERHGRLRRLEVEAPCAAVTPEALSALLGA